MDDLHIEMDEKVFEKDVYFGVNYCSNEFN